MKKSMINSDPSGKKRSLVLGFMLIMLLAFSTSLIAQTSTQPSNYETSDGSSGDPYFISSLDNLYWLSQTSDDWNKYYKQTTNIDATATSGWDSNAGFSPIGIGGVSPYFTGTYDGDGHIIDELTINRPSTQPVGLFGSVQDGTIKNLGLTNVDIIGYGYIGALIGEGSATIQNCLSTGTISGAQTRVGGVGGSFGGGTTISNCYSTCDVTRRSGSWTEYGAFCGYVNSGTVEYCYSTGSVYYTGTTDPTDKGFLGITYNSPTLTDNFWDSEISNQSTGTGATAKTTPLMKQQSTFTNWDFDVDGISAGHNGNWIMAGYPHLQMEWSATISDLTKLQMVALDLDEVYTQSADIDASATSSWNYDGSDYDGFSPIGNSTTEFTGSYDGDGHTNDGLFISRASTSYVGLFGWVYTATIDNLGVTNVNITGNGTVGGLVGNNYSSTVSNSYSTGSVSGNDTAGGLVGYNRNTVQNCYSTGDVTRSSGTEPDFGGFCGRNFDGTIEYCYSTGDVTYDGTNPTDKGFVGSQGGTNTYTYNFWDSQESNQTSGTGAIAKNTPQMKTQSTFTSWNFTTIWEIVGGDGANYPRLIDNPDPTLPVTLSAFTAQYIESIPVLCWTTQSETSNAGWNIYRGETNEALSNEEAYQLNLSLGLIPGAGSTSEPTDYSFEDVFPIIEGSTYFYWLESVDYSGESEIYGPISLTIPENEWQNPNSPEIPKPYGLHQNYPNPFNPSTEKSFMMKESCIGELSIYNIKGQKMKTIFTNLSIPRNELLIYNWNGKDESGKEVSTGVYYYKLLTTKGNFVRKMILMK